MHHYLHSLSKTAATLVFITLGVLSNGALAQKVYRCGNTYSQAPCPGGDAVDTSGSQVRGEAQKAQAEAAKSAKAADKMEKSRLAQEKRDRANNGATVITAQPLPKETAQESVPKTAAKSKPKSHAPEHFTAKAPAEPKGKTGKAKTSDAKE